MKNIQKKVMPIKGLHCKSCVNLIESKVKSLNGIKDVKVDLIENKFSVKFDSEEISLDKIISEIESLGYSIKSSKSEIKNKNILHGLFYGLIPHIGCILFIVGSIFGVTIFMEFFKPILMNKYFFYILMLISLTFATVSSILYLRKNGLLSSKGIKRKWKYLLGMYGSTIGVNLILFLIIFPLLANVSAKSTIGNSLDTSNNEISYVKLKVDIPCSGHAPLISEELKSIDGVEEIQFGLPNIFDVKYNPSKTSKQNILSLEVFKTYKATIIDEPTSQNDNLNEISEGCCGTGNCGSLSGGCGCGKI